MYQMMLCNRTSRYDIAAEAVRSGALFNSSVAPVAHSMASFFMHCAAKDKEYILAQGKGESSRWFLGTEDVLSGFMIDPETTFQTPEFH